MVHDEEERKAAYDLEYKDSPAAFIKKEDKPVKENKNKVIQDKLQEKVKANKEKAKAEKKGK